ADPRAFALTLDAWEAYDRLGSPEGELAIANSVVYLACAPKSNAVYVAMGEAMADVEQYGTLDVPLRLRNAPTRLMKGLGYGGGYRYAHEEPDALNLARRGYSLDVGALRTLEERRKAAQLESDRLRAERNANAKAVGMAK